MSPLRRRVLSLVAGHPQVRKAVVSMPGIRGLAWRFVAGETPASALVLVRAMGADGMSATLNHVGTHVRDAAEADAATEEIIRAMHLFSSSGVATHVSVKLTQIGLDVDPALGLANIRRILDAGTAAGCFVRIDMEEARYVERTLDLFEQLRDQYGRDSVGIVLQSYLRDRRADVERLTRDGSRIRLVKGGYWEASDVVLRDSVEIDRAFLADIESLLRHGHRPAIATHDEQMIHATRRLAREIGREPGDFEFQFLYGVRPELARALVREGYQCRIYVPYGGDWYAYVLGCIRRVGGDVARRVVRRRPVRRRREPQASAPGADL